MCECIRSVLCYLGCTHPSTICIYKCEPTFLHTDTLAHADSQRHEQQVNIRFLVLQFLLFNMTDENWHTHTHTQREQIENKTKTKLFWHSISVRKFEAKKSSGH